MIPHYSPPFGPGRVIAAWLSPAHAPSVAELEREFARALDVPAAVIVPSVRSAILMLVKAVMQPDTTVVGPAYTCDVVHEAMELSGARTWYVEPTANSFHMDADTIATACGPGACLIVSEMYGLRYPDAFLRATDAVHSRLRILDMAMCVPDRSGTARMRHNDVALFSFGFGKPMCAGGGGVACFQDGSLAETVARMRDEMQVETSSSLRTNLKVLASVALRTRFLCRAALASQDWRHRRETAQRRKTTTTANTSSASRPHFVGPEWTHTMTAAERRLARRNLRQADGSAQLRQRQAEAYVNKLHSFGIVPELGDALPQSHFAIRVPSQLRDNVRTRLRRDGIDAGDEFALSGVLRRGGYPLAERAAAEVLTLPLGESVSTADVGRICSAVTLALD
jgi:dTDP-4-amino-4,6-dideoxygalactose transaminase